jgi:multidrug efflux pump subunit AcrA (membrane-fusion protein)
MYVSAIFLGLLLAAPARQGQALPDSVTIDNCLIGLDEEAQVPAQEAGTIKKLYVVEGQHVKAGELLAQIDDNLPRMELRVAESKLKVAKKQAASEINVIYSKAAAEAKRAVAVADASANKKFPGTVAETVVQEHLLDYKAATLSIEKSQMEQDIAKLQVNVSQAELDAAQEKMDRRQIKSPLDGQVRKIYPHVGEWVQQSDPVVQVLRVNRLRVEGFLSSSDFDPLEVSGRPVTISVKFARERVETFSGQIDFVDPRIQRAGQYLVRAVIQNRQLNGQWLLRAGLTAEMTIHLK